MFFLLFKSFFILFNKHTIFHYIKLKKKKKKKRYIRLKFKKKQKTKQKTKNKKNLKVKNQKNKTITKAKTTKTPKEIPKDKKHITKRPTPLFRKIFHTHFTFFLIKNSWA